MKAERIQNRARLLAGAGFAALTIAAVAHAQDPEAETGPEQAAGAQEQAAQPAEVIQVTGIRASLRSSINTKRNETSIVEAITSEDIGRLPDVSIAESLARLPGLTAQRVDGRAQVISVRGLAPDFTTALLNGREQVSTGDNRGVEFDQYPSELLGSVVTYKTPDASLVGQGLAGTVDLRTVRPLDFDERTVALNARYEWNDQGALNAGSEANGQRLSGSLIDQNADGTMGFAIGVALTDSPTQAERWNAWGYADVPEGVVIGGAKPYVQSNNLERLGVMGVFEYEPSDRLNLTIDGYYSEFDEQVNLRGIELPLGFGPDGTSTLQPGYTVEDGLVTEGAFEEVDGVIRNDVNRRESEVLSIGANLDFAITDQWRGQADVAFSQVDRVDTLLETYSGFGFNRTGPSDTLGFSLSPSGGPATFRPTLNYADESQVVLTSPQGWGGDIFLDNDGNPAGQAGFLNMPSVEDELATARFNAQRDLDFGVFSRFEAGFSYADRSKSKFADEFFLGLANGEAEQALPGEYLLEPTELEYLGIPGMVSYDPQAALADGGVYRTQRNVNADVVTKEWIVEEKVTTLYAMADLDAQLGAFPLTGNIGVQAVHTDQSSSGFQATGAGEFVGITGGDEYWEFLPSTNLSLEVADNTFVRFAAARTLARARMDQMSASQEVFQNEENVGNDDINEAYWGANGGNPELRPWIANQVDISFEKYFGSSGYFAAAAFYKDLETYIYTQNSEQDFSNLEPSGGNDPVLDQGLLSQAANGDGGSIQGLEFSLSVPLDLIWAPLEGFGVIANASFTESEIEPEGPGTATALPGLSEEVINLTAYYERGGFEARISQRHRSDFLGEVQGYGAGREFRTVRAESVVDTQIGYRWDNGPLDGLSVLFQVNNLTDEEFQTFQNGDERQVIDYQQYGRTFLAGVNYRF